MIYTVIWEGDKYQVKPEGKGHYLLFKGKVMYQLDANKGYCSCKGFMCHKHCKHWKIVQSIYEGEVKKYDDDSEIKTDMYGKIRQVARQV